jgi:hypothetical protein
MSADLSDHGFTVPTDAEAENDPNPAADPAGVDPDDEPEQCAEPGCTRDAHRKQASQIWPDLPDEPLCKVHIQGHA